MAAGLAAVWAWDPTEVTASAVLVGVAALAAAFARHASTGVGRALRGVRAEEQVAAVLRRTGARQVVHGALLGAGGDADHVVLGPYLAVIESKSGDGHVRVDDRGLHVESRLVPGNPVSQARRQAAALGRIVGGFSDAIVCVTGMTNPPVRVGNTIVCSARDLKAVVAGLNHRIGSDLADTVAHRAASGYYDRPGRRPDGTGTVRAGGAPPRQARR
jgi:hypothetical protein